MGAKDRAYRYSVLLRACRSILQSMPEYTAEDVRHPRARSPPTSATASRRNIDATPPFIQNTTLAHTTPICAVRAHVCRTSPVASSRRRPRGLQAPATPSTHLESVCRLLTQCPQRTPHRCSRTMLLQRARRRCRLVVRADILASEHSRHSHLSILDDDLASAFAEIISFNGLENNLTSAASRMRSLPLPQRRSLCRLHTASLVEVESPAIESCGPPEKNYSPRYRRPLRGWLSPSSARRPFYPSSTLPVNVP